MVLFYISNTKNKKAPNLQAEYNEIMNVFKSCDKNKDGKLSKEEVKAGFRRLQSRFPAFRTLRAFKMADDNGDGYIDEAELDALVTYALECYESSVNQRLG